MRNFVPHPYRYGWPLAEAAVLAGLIALPAQAQTPPAEPNSNPTLAAPATVPDSGQSAPAATDSASSSPAETRTEPAQAGEVQTGAGLFEQSTSASAPKAESELGATSPRAFELNGYVRS